MIADKTFVSLVVNCGFARVGILELSRLPKGVFRTLSHKRKRAQDFQTLFSTFTFPSQYFEEDQARKTSLFDRHCEIVIRSCSKKWHPTESRAEYLETFKLSVWRSLSSSLQQKHSYSKCNECGRKYMHLQEKIPFHPCFIPSGDVLNHTTIHDESLSEKQLTQRIFSQLNGSFRERFGHNFSESAVKFCGTSENISERISKNQKKKEKRKLQRSFRNHLNEQFRENAALSLLSEKESMGSYQRKRLLQSFEKRAEPCPKRSHIPSDENIHFDVSQICKDVESWPTTTDHITSTPASSNQLCDSPAVDPITSTPFPSPEVSASESLSHAFQKSSLSLQGSTVDPVTSTPVSSTSASQMCKTPSRQHLPQSSSAINISMILAPDREELAKETKDNESYRENAEIAALPFTDQDVAKSSREWKTTHGLSLYRILGTSTELVKFDNLHCLLKRKHDKKKLNSKDISLYKDLLAKLQQKVIQSHGIIRSQLSNLEKSYFRKNAELPANEEYPDLFAKYKHIKCLLRIWNISL